MKVTPLLAPISGIAGGPKAKARAPGILENVHVLEDGLKLFVRRFAFAPFFQRNEKDATVSRVGAAEEIPARDSRVLLDAGRLLQNLFALSHHGVGATGGRRRAWRHGLRFGGSRSCGHLFALGAVRLRVAEAGVISNALRLAEGSRCGLRVL
jgi:hypothetical protein